jgi:putative transposase
MEALGDLTPDGGVIAMTCDALNVSRASFYRRQKRLRKPPSPSSRSKPARSLGVTERQIERALCQNVLGLLRTPSYVDLAPAEIYASLLDQGIYHCSIRTMYRWLHEHDEIKERRKPLRPSACPKPELLAEAPNQVWSWDITKMMGPAKWTYFYLYLIIDIFSRRAVGWRLADTESAALFKPLFHDAVDKNGVVPGQLILHADRGPSMKAKATAFLLADLGVTKSHSRPYTSNDNPFSESHFKTLK